LTDKQESHQDNSTPDYIITSGQDAIPASIHYADLFKKAFSGMKIKKEAKNNKSCVIKSTI
jgi:hypothetical protein